MVGTSDGSDVLSQLQQLQLQHAQLQKRLDSQSGNRSHNFTNDSRPRQTNWSSGPRQQGRWKRNPSDRPVPPRDRAGGSFQHTVGSAENSAVDFSGAHEVSAVDGGIPLSIYADSGATNVVTRIREALTDYVPFGAGEGQVCLADKSVESRAAGYGTLTLHSKSTDSLLTFPNVLHMPTARRTLVCLGKTMRSGVFWRFDRHDGGSIEVAGKGHWGEIVLASNDLLFLNAVIEYPRSHPAKPRPAVPAPRVQSVEVSNAELIVTMCAS